jgi:hypothetical protein
MTLPFDAAALERIGRAAAAEAWRGGMSVLKPDGTVVPIPLVAEPEPFAPEELVRLAREARALLSGSVKLARALLSHGDARDREALLGPFQGLEAEAMARLFDEAPVPALVARVDFLRSGEPGAPARALELNATIPAMPAYADLAAHSWLRAAARERGLPPRVAEDLVAECGSNMEEFRRTLSAYHALRGGTVARPSIAIVARPGDAQIGELRRLAEHFRQMGHRVENLTPASCRPGEWDLLYRHVWAHNTPPDSPFAAALRSPGRFVLANPVNGLLEAKALFARLSECGADAALAALAGLDDEELGAARRIPWTRRLDAGLVPRLLAGREGFVLKRSWDYGGKSVLLGAELTEEEWRRGVEAALADTRGGGFVVQERIFAAWRPATRITPEGTFAGQLVRDVSTYAGLGPVCPGGSVVRAAASPIVNILGGGGLAPVIPAPVLARLA